MEALRELINHYDLEEDREHIIIPFTDGAGRKNRCFLLKRPYMRIQYPDGHLLDFPLEEIIEATVRYPELPLRDSLAAVHAEMDAHIASLFGERRPDEKEDTDQRDVP